MTRNRPLDAFGVAIDLNGKEPVARSGIFEAEQIVRNKSAISRQWKRKLDAGPCEYLATTDIAYVECASGDLERRAHACLHELMDEWSRPTFLLSDQRPALGKRDLSSRRQIVHEVLVPGVEGGELLRWAREIGALRVAIVEMGQAEFEVGEVAACVPGQFMKVVGRQRAVPIDCLEQEVVGIREHQAAHARLRAYVAKPTI